MKKLLVIFLTILIVISTASMAYAENSKNEVETEVTKEEALDITKDFIKKAWNLNISDTDKLDVELRKDSRKDRNDKWLITWYQTNKNYILVEVDSGTGIVKYAFYNIKNENDFTIMDIDEAKVIANNFLKEVNYEFYKQTQFKNYTYEYFSDSVVYIFEYTRKLNGITVADNSFFIEVSADKKIVTRYICNWDPTPIKAKNNVMSKYKVKSLLEKSLNLQAIYKEIDEDIIITYNTFLPNAYAIDATKGTIIDKRGYEVDYKASLDINNKQKDSIYEDKEVIVYSEPISGDEALEVIQQYLTQLYGDSYFCNPVEYVEDNNIPIKTYLCNFRFNKNDKLYSGTIYINVLTKDLYYVCLNNPDGVIKKLENEEQWQDCYDKAISTIAELLPNRIKSVNTKQDLYSKQKNLFSFSRINNDIINPYNGITIRIDPKDFIVTYFNYYWSNMQLPDDNNIISSAKALEYYLAGYLYEPYYLKINTSEYYELPNYEYRLVYSIPFNYYRKLSVDALTGKIIDKFGDEYEVSPKTENQNITKNDALKSITEMLMDIYHISRYGSYSRPLFTNIDNNHPKYEFLKYAIHFGLIKNEEVEYQGDNHITRIELAKLLIKTLKYEEIASISDMYKPKYSDSKLIGKEYLGYATICDALKLIKTENNKFRPNDYVSDLELLIAVSYLKHYIY